MSETGPMDPARGDGGRPAREPRGLFELVAVFLVIADLWLLAALLTEWLNSQLIRLGGDAYMLAYILLVFLLMGITVTAARTLGGPGMGAVSIKTPVLLQRGYLRIRRWIQGASYRLVLCSLAIGIVCALAGRNAMDVVDSIYQGTRPEFFRTLAMVISAFGLGVIGLLGSSLIAGLPPAKPPGD